MVEMTAEKSVYLELTADVVAAFVGKNSVPASELPGLIDKVHGAFISLGTTAEAPEVVELKPAVPIRKSVQHDYIVCLEDGVKFKSLKRHLRTKYNMTPEQYREKWGLPNDYPMVAPNYAAARSALAKKMGLGQQRSKAVLPATPPAVRGRKKAA